MTGKGSERFRNYGAVLEQHSKEMRLKKIFRVVTFLLIILIIVVLIFIVNQVEEKASKKKTFHAEKIMMTKAVTVGLV